ncbi:hypothetical protein MMC22_005849 [Lobaria immixta]|nr:hypothetical protein [Lobaria immixta]
MVATQQTLRVTGLPSKTQQSDVIHFFTERINRRDGRQIVESVGPICGHASRSTMRTTVSFSSSKTAQKALELGEPSRRLTAENGGAETITVDASFRDLTTLHSSNNPATGKPDVDIVALHGLTGHGWNSFATSSSVDKNAGRTKETNWLRDILPRLLEQNQQQHIHPRVMTYGYDADVWMTRNVADIDAPVNNLLTYLDIERREAIVALANEAMLKNLQEPQDSTKQYNFPVKGCMFFGVPNCGADIAGTASSILTLLNSVFNVNRNVVRDLESKSQQLANFADEFRLVRKEHNIPVISFYETVRYSYALGLIVDKDSAVIEYPGSPRPFGINRNHKEMARFSGDETHALEPAIDFLAQFARNAVNARQHSHPSVSRTAPYVIDGSNLEDEYSILESYHTVFLVDDSPSMAGKRWDLVKKILDYSTRVATKYDPDGIDVHFLNNKTANQDNIKDPAIAVKVHQNIMLKGNTPTLDQLSRHLNSYVEKFKSRKTEEINFKGYNLIVLTDGEPNPAHEDLDEISDVEDARRYSAAYRRIRKTIVGVARALDKAGAEHAQVGIQFCQIGEDDGAYNFFEYLDNQIKGKYKLGRDMVDTVHCSSEADLTQTFFYKLLLGAIDKVADNKEISKDSSQREGTGWSPEERPTERSYLAQNHSDPQTTTIRSFHGEQTSTYPQQPPTPQFVPTSSYAQQHPAGHQYPYQQQPSNGDQYGPIYPQLPRPSTLPPNATELPIRTTRSSTFGTKTHAAGWRPPS